MIVHILIYFPLSPWFCTLMRYERLQSTLTSGRPPVWPVLHWSFTTAAPCNQRVHLNGQHHCQASRHHTLKVGRISRRPADTYEGRYLARHHFNAGTYEATGQLWSPLPVPVSL